MELNTLLTEALERNASDIHLQAFAPPVFRQDGALVRRSETGSLSPDDVAALLLPALPEMARAAFADGLTASAEGLLREADRSFHLLAFREQGRVAGNVRVMMDEPPGVDVIGFETADLLRQFAKTPRGLILFTGPTGSGKATTACAVLEEANRTAPGPRIFVIEEAPSYTFTSKEGLVTAIHVGQDAESYERAAQTVMKGADPDIVYFGDLPTVEAMRAAMVLADTGHLVLANLSAESAAEALELFCAALPEPRASQRALLARTLVAVLNQRLVVRAGGSGRVPAYEVLMATPAVRDILRAGGNATELRARMERDADAGSRTTDAALDALVAAGAITEEVAALHRSDPSRSQRLPV